MEEWIIRNEAKSGGSRVTPNNFLQLYISILLVFGMLFIPLLSEAASPAAPPGYTATTTTFTSAPGAAIADLGTVVENIAVSGLKRYIFDVDLTTFITHTFAADLDITLTSPAGTVVTITTDNGAGNDDVFNGTLWDDDGGDTNPPGPATDNVYVNLVVETPLVPEEALGAFIGEDPNGTWTLTIVDDLGGDSGTLHQWSLDITTLNRPPITATTTFSSAPGAAIPDLGTVVENIAVSGLDSYLFDVDLTTFITHTWNEDLDITLTSPAGTVVTITTDNGAGNDDVFNGTLWDDDGGDTNPPGPATDHIYANLVLATPLVPEEALGAFIGEDPNGTWTLTIVDDAGLDLGTLHQWSLDITTTSPPPPPPPPPTDRDGDGIGNTEEQGPNGDNPNYDGNGDGIPDWQQCNVASFVTFTEEGQHYLTIELPWGECFSRVYALGTFPLLPPWLSLPFGYFSFEVTGLEDGACTTVTVYLDGEAPQTYYKYGPTPDNPSFHWYEFSFDGETGAELIDESTVVLHFCDGKRGDRDLSENGKILDPGGPAAIETREELYFPFIANAEGDATSLGIINTEHYPVTSMIQFYRPDGTLVASEAGSVAGLGKAEIASEAIPSEAASAVVWADGDIVGFGRFVSSLGQRYAVPASTQLSRSITVPYDQPDPSWSNKIILFNPADEAVTVTYTDAAGVRSETLLEAKEQILVLLDTVHNPRLIEATGNIAAMEVFLSLVSGGDAGSILLGNTDQVELLVPTIFFGTNENTGLGVGNSSEDDAVTAFGYNAGGEEEEIPLGLLPARSVLTANLSRLFSPDTMWVKIVGISATETPFGPSPLPVQGLASYWEADYGKVGTISLNGLKFREGCLGVSEGEATPTYAFVNANNTQARVTASAYRFDGTLRASGSITIAPGTNMTGPVASLVGGMTLESGDYLWIESDVDLSGFETIYADGRMEILPVLK